MSKGDSSEYDRLMMKEPSMWSVPDVGLWLQFINLGDYRVKFIENFISGIELLDLTEEDIISLGVSAMGHRKKLLARIKDLNKRENGQFNDNNDSTSDDNNSDHSFEISNRSTSSLENNTKVAIKCFYKNEVKLLSVAPNIGIDKLKRTIKKEFGRRMNIQAKDNDGDLITIKTDKDFANIIRHAKPPIRFNLSRRERRTRGGKEVSREDIEPELIPQAEIAVLNTLLNGCIIIGDDGYIKYFNPAASKMFGYSSDEVIGHNVKLLMPSMYAANHDKFLNDYLKTGRAKIIGSSRRVIAKHKNGYNFPVELAITETHTATRRTFTGMLTPVNESEINAENNVTSEKSTFLTLEGLIEPALCIDTKGTIIYANSASREFFGYPEVEMVGHNISMLMPSPYKENHDHYLHNYAATNKSTVIGKTRPLICEIADGSILPINLSVSEVVLPNGKKIFTGILRKREVIQRKEKTMLQQEREVVNGLYVASIIIDEKGNVQAFNKSAQKIFGYDLSEILGQNVKIITGPHKDKHDQYLKNYYDTGVPKVIGKEREVTTVNKFGQNIRIKLSIVEKKDEEGKRFFTGMLHQV